MKSEPKITFKKMPGAWWCLTAYEVFLNGVSIGFVWSAEGFSYRGDQGWNRGVRIRDYHPTEWHYGLKLDYLSKLGFGEMQRGFAVNRLIEEVTRGR